MKIKFEYYKDKLNKIYNEFDANIAHSDKIKCIKGCYICCRNVCIMLYPVEAACIARKLRKFKNISTLEIIKNRIAKAKEIFDAVCRTAPITFINNVNESNTYFDKIDIVNTNLTECPFLINNICSVYSVRPLICRGFISTSVEECKTIPEIMKTKSYSTTFNMIGEKINQINKEFVKENKIVPDVIQNDKIKGVVFNFIEIDNLYNIYFISPENKYTIK